jgi:hypothetical protein
MKTKIIDNWEVELTNDRGDTLTLKGEWYADFFKEYDGKQLIIADVVGRSEQLKAISDLKDFAYEVCPLHREDDLEEIVGRL